MKLFAFYALLDRAFSYLFPLLVLYLLASNGIYTDLEVILSISVLLSMFADFGLKNYYLYASINKADKKLKAKSNTFIGILILAMFFYVVAFHEYVDSIAVLCIIRTTTLMLINYITVYGRSIDKPGLGVQYSLFINVVNSCSVLLLFFLGYKESFFLVYGILNSLPGAIFVFLILFRVVGSAAIDIGYLTKLTKYSLPIIISSSIALALITFFRTFADQKFSVEVATLIMLSLRNAMLIQLGHSIFISYYSKRLLETTSSFLKESIFKKYILVMVFFYFVTILLAKVVVVPVVSAEGATIYLVQALCGCAVLLWCISSVFEFNFNKIGRNVPLVVINGTAFLFWLLIASAFRHSIVSYSLSLVITYLLIFVVHLIYDKVRNV